MNRLRQQVASERRKRKLIFYTIVFLSFLYLIINMIFGDMGMLKYRNIHNKKTALKTMRSGKLNRRTTGSGPR